jgi:penicillin amidase
LLGQLLEGWDAQETEGSVAATVYQYVYRNFARQVLADELGDLAPVYLDEWYLWQERLELMVAEGNSPWFDRMDTPDKRETAQDNLLEAGLAALEELKANFGDDHMQWEWGKVHTIRFVNPLVREGWAAGLVGGQTWPAAGSGETLYRARHSFEDPTEVGFGAAMRMVVDLGQDDYVMAVLSGGQQARTFSPRQSDQLPDFFGGGVRYWWYSEAQIKAHTQGVWVLQPE